MKMDQWKAPPPPRCTPLLTLGGPGTGKSTPDDRGGYHGNDRGGYHGNDCGGYHGNNGGGYHGNGGGRNNGCTIHTFHEILGMFSHFSRFDSFSHYLLFKSAKDLEFLQLRSTSLKTFTLDPRPKSGLMREDSFIHGQAYE